MAEGALGKAEAFNAEGTAGTLGKAEGSLMMAGTLGKVEGSLMMAGTLGQEERTLGGEWASFLPSS